MTKYEALVEDIVQDDVLLIPSTSIKHSSKSMCYEDECVIFMNESAFETDAERTVALAHEKGHCDSGAFYCVHTPFETRERCEHRAWQWAVIKQLPVKAFSEAMQFCRTADGVSVYDLAEYLNVTPEFIRRAMDVYIALGERFA